MTDQRRRLLIGAVGLVKGSVKHGGAAMVAVCDKLEPVFDDTAVLMNAPFDCLSLIIRYGHSWGNPTVGRINKRHAELEVSIEVPMGAARDADEDALFSIVHRAALRSIVTVCHEYQLEVAVWSQLLEDVDK